MNINRAHLPAIRAAILVLCFVTIAFIVWAHEHYKPQHHAPTHSTTHNLSSQKLHHMISYSKVNNY